MAVPQVVIVGRPNVGKSTLTNRMLGEDRVVAFDQRGHGGSTIGSDGIGSRQMASDYGAVLEAYDVNNGVLVGHSMGGFLALAFLLGARSRA